MSFYSQWQEVLQDKASAVAQETVRQYDLLETAAYDWILNHVGESLSGTAASLAQMLGFGTEMVIFLGFLDGLQTSLANPTDLASVEDETLLDLEIDFRRLYRNMLEARADWLYTLKAWEKVLPQEERRQITRDFKEAMIVRVDKTGRNDPCPCGSGKKFKHCCGRG